MTTQKTAKPVVANREQQQKNQSLTRTQILATLNHHAAEIKARFHVQRLGLFGSYVRDEARPGSDVDILVEFVSPTFDAYMNLKFFLEELLCKNVDLVMVDSLKPRIKSTIMDEVQYAQGLQAVP